MPTYKYEVVNLRRVPHGREDQFHWHSDAEGVIGGHECLGEFLNLRGAKGWKIASHVSDGHFGNTIVLQQAEGEQEKRVEVRVERETPVVTQAIDVGALAKSIGDELKDAVKKIPPVVIPTPPTAQAIAQAVTLPVPISPEEVARAVELQIAPLFQAVQPAATEIATCLSPLFSSLLAQLEEQNRRLQGLQELMTPVAITDPLIEKRVAARWLPWRRSPSFVGTVSN